MACVIKSERGYNIFVEADMNLGHPRRMLEGVVDYLHGRALHRRLHWGSELPSKLSLERAGFDGLIRYHFHEPYDSHGLPTVWISSSRYLKGATHAVPDHRAVGRLAGEHFIERLYTQFAYVGLSDAAYARERLEGFREAVGDAPVREFPVPTDPGLSSAMRGFLKDFLHSLPPHCAVFGTDAQIHHVATLCHAEGIRVPEDIALLGADNDVLLIHSSPLSYSSIDLDSERIGQCAAECLESMLQSGRDDGQIVRVPPRGIVLRASTDHLATDDTVIVRAVRLIRQEACAGLTVGELCRQLGMGRRAFEKRFRSVLGKSPDAEIRRTRMERAAHLLASTRLSVEQVAETCGFADAFYFSTAFRKAHGLSPREWRRRPA